MNGGLHRFRDRVDPGLLSEIDAWIGRHPLVRIRSALEARTDEKAFFDALAEAALKKINRFKQQALVDTGWAFDLANAVVTAGWADT